MSSGPAGRWDDLNVRLVSSVVIAVIGVLGCWAGGIAFLVLTVVVCAVMVWELARMLDPDSPAIAMAGVAALCLTVANFLPPGFALPLLIAPALVGFGQLPRRRASFTIFTVLILLAGFGLYTLRTNYGFLWLGWLLAVVIVTDVCGYFAGRYIGGPKFWPRVSPKKTWSGTAAGWIGAAIVGVAMALWTGADLQLAGISVSVSMASQLGDIAESAVKRRVGVKDSSTLLPGHGGVFDRFDGMLGGAVFLLLISALIDFPPGVV
ncbi:phosphatidate cytidylyltransferase [Tranquillimonas rosea]|uniref:Phosphatidate cytidylyltransferase n=1 Tax=Tranquillimonas rosea TaxID=641238 RepID=A0A1H9PDH3_9RHOB|nr:phosphatidate cytidylyltransferase [Tranquillimonas rosea]SER46274.1 phosphatidate cytidylyltransferase [Tranquillimonas rosea]